MAIGDVFTLHAQWFNPSTGLTAENQFHFQQNTTLIFDTPGEDLVARFIDEPLPVYEGLVYDGYALVRFAVYSQPGNLLVYDTAPTGLSGTLTGTPMPAPTAGLISYRTAHLGRSGKGRIYIPPAVETQSSGNGPETGYLTTMNAFADLLEGMNGSSIAFAQWIWGLWSETDQAFYPETSYVSRPRWATIRLRAR